MVENLNYIVDSLQSVRNTLMRLQSVIDECYEIENNGTELQLMSGTNWDEFKKVFDQQSKIVDRRRPSPTPVSNRRSSDMRRRSSTILGGFSLLQSSEENHKSSDMKFYGIFANIRSTLDYTYHKNYTYERQRFQDAIIQEFLNDAVITDGNGEICTTPTQPWIVFTAGAMGAGKGYTLKKLVEKGRFPLIAFVRVDPDAIRRYLPEFDLYVQQSPEKAGELTNKEAGYIAEILTLAGLQSGKNVIVDGSLRRVQWYNNTLFV